MLTKKTFEIDGDRFSTLEGFYDEINRVLLQGAGWGQNLDAFDDILSGGFGTPHEGFVLYWRNSEVSRERLGYAETVRQLELRLARCHPTNRIAVGQQLEIAKSQSGETVFDWLVEIIRAHGPGGAESEDAVDLILA